MTRPRGSWELPALAPGGRIFLVSLLALYLEVLLIRWLAAEIPLFASLPNLALLVAFFGLSVGCLASRRPAWPPLSALCLLGVVLVVLDPMRLELVPFKTAHMVLLWKGNQAPPFGELALALLVVLFSCGLLAGVFLPLGQRLGLWMDEHPRPIEACSWNGLGGLAGVWLFQAQSQLWAPPEAWFAVASPLMLGVMAGGRQRLLAAGFMALVLGFAAFTPPLVGLGDPEDRRGETTEYVEAMPDYRTLWSPYHKIGVRERFLLTPSTGERVSTGYMFRLTDLKFQRIVHLAPEFVQAHPDLYPPESVARSDYNLPYRLGLPPPENVLVAGAGTGNDVAAALRAGAKRVVAVEIDPAFVELGRQLHPEKPYDDPRVEVVLDDARAFFRRCRERFDVVLFGHLSSGTLGNSIQPMSYFYTGESFQEARRLLKPGRGYLVGSVNWAEISYVRLRIRQMLTDAFGTPPLLYENPDLPDHLGNPGLCYVAAEPGLLRGLAALRPPDPESGLERVPPEVAALLPSDDWPFLFLRRASLPRFHAWVLGAVGFLCLLSVPALKTRKDSFASFSFFFSLGAGFMLLEVHTISRAGLLLGMTWATSAAVLSTVLALGLASNLTAARLRLESPLGPLLGLYASLVLRLLVPLEAFDLLPGGLRALGALAFLGLPLYFAGLVFVIRFAAVSRRDLALGANLVGALAGGAMEYLAFVFGLQGIAVLVLGLYLLAGLAWAVGRSWGWEASGAGQPG